MIDPFPNLATLDDAGLVDIADLEGGLADPFDDVPDFDPAEAPEVDLRAGLDDAQLHLRRPTRRLFHDFRPNPDAIKTLDKLPAEGETLHAVMHQRHSMWDLVPALIARTKRRIADLHICTLSYSKETSADLLGLFDEGRIRRVSLMVSAYFKAQNPQLYDGLVQPLIERRQRVMAMRTHAKIMLVKLAGGGSFVCEGSANLRSCKNIEQFTLTRCRTLYRFHREWMEREILSRCKTGGDS